MTISSANRKAGPYVGNGSATSFAFSFKVFTAADVVVTKTTLATGVEAVLVLTTDYTVSLNADQNANPGGSVTYAPSPTMAATHSLTLTSAVAQTQGTDIPSAGGWYPEVVENALDKATILTQQQQEVLDRTIRFPVAETGAVQLPAAVVRASKIIGFDANGDVTVYPAASAVYGVLYDYQVATAGQTVFNLGFAYSLGIHNLRVFVDGFLQRAYTETGPSQVTFSYPLQAGMEVEFFAGQDTVGAVGDASSVSYTPSGTGAVTTNVRDKLRESVSVKDFGAKGDGVTDDSAAIQAAITAAAAQPSADLHWPDGDYSITAELVAASMEYAAWRAVGDVNIIWNGATDSTKAMLRITITASREWHHNTIGRFNFNANRKAGFCVVLEGGAGGGGTANTGGHNRWNDCSFEGATVANFLLGDNDEPYADDLDSSKNLWDHCTFYNAQYNFKQNALNTVGNTLRSCVFGSNLTDVVLQHVRNVRGVGLLIDNPEFGAIGNYTNDDCTSVFAKNATHIRSVYMEESRLLLVEDGANYNDRTYIVDGVHVNDSRNDANLNRRYFIRQVTNGRQLSLKNAQLGVSGALCPIRLLYWAGPADFENVDLHGGHLIGESVAGFANPLWSVDGVRPWEVESLTANWDFARWLDSVGLPTGDTPAVWAQSPGAGATLEVTATATNARYGVRVALLNVTVAGTTASGLTANINKNGYITVVFSGKVNAQATLPRIVVGGTDITTTVSFDEAGDLNGTRFVAWGEADLRGNNNSTIAVRIGIKENLTGSMHVDTAVVLPFRVRAGMAPAFITARPDQKRPAVYTHTAAPTWGTWERGDIIWRSDATAAGPPGWICTVAGTPGTWKAMANIAA